MRSVEIRIQTANVKNLEKWRQPVCEVLLGALLFSGLYISYTSMLGLGGHTPQILAVGMVVILAVCLLSDRRGFFVFAMPGIALVFAAVMLAGNHILADGLKTVANQVMEIAGKSGNMSYTQFFVEGTEAERSLSETCFLLFPAVLLAFFGAVTVKYKRCVFALAMLIPVFVLQMLFHVTPNVCAALLAVFAVLAVAAARFMRRAELWMFAAAGCVFALLSLGAGRLFSISGYAANAFVQNIRDAAKYTVYDLRYERGKPNSFTQGDFQRLSSLELWEEPALNVTMSDPQSYYLRGFVGSVYTSERWESLPKERVYEEYPSYYWLHQGGFDALNQLSLLEELSLDDGRQEQVEITIDNVNANSKYLYLPYELSSFPEDFGDVEADADITVTSGAFAGTREYSFQAAKNTLSRYPEVLENLEKQADKKREQIDENKKNERNYRLRVYEDYLEVPAGVSALFSTLFGGKAFNDSRHVDCAQAVEFVKDYLESHVSYDTQATGVKRGEDFLQKFLSVTKKGYSVHYATAATMMFRYMGIPSRYVEGYLITPDDIEGAGTNETIEIMGMNAHAWAEIYLDGVGWIPVEVTPPYYGIMEQVEIPGSSALSADNGGTGDGEEGLAPQEVAPPDVADTLDKDRMDVATILRIAGFVILAVFFLALFFTILFLVVRRKRRLSRRAALFGGENVNLAVCGMLAYLEKLFAAAGIEKTGASARTYRKGIGEAWSPAYAKRYGTILAIGQRAAFSAHALSEEERAKVAEYKDMALQKFTDGLKWSRKLKLKYLDGLY